VGTLLEPRLINRGNLREAVQEVLAYAQTVRAKVDVAGSGRAHLTQLALDSLETIERELDKPPSERVKYANLFSRTLSDEGGEVDPLLEELVLKIWDVYRRWHQTIP
jgi:hypothetical protein